MGGDHGPTVVIPAALHCLKQHEGLRLILVGDQEVIRQQLALHRVVENERLQVWHASQKVEMDESPILALRNKKDSSMRIAINLVKGGAANACVSAGNTGALMATAKFVLKTVPGIDRPAIIYSMPTQQEDVTVRVLDLGANVDSEPEHLLQFAMMGSLLTSALDNIKEPRIGLLNIGKEDIKGNEQVKQAAQLFAKSSAINYIGYVEGDEIYQGVADVVVCDGFVGNVALKVSEGVAKLIIYYLKKEFKRNWLTRLSALVAMPVLKSLAKRIDPSRYNGASLVGLQGIVIKSHGGANKEAFANAINQARLEVAQDVPHRIAERIGQLLQSSGENV